jgi:DNA-binding NtrC family response regulator
VGAARPSAAQIAQHELHDAVAATGESLRMAEAEYIRQALARHRGNLTQAAAQLGIAKSTLYEKLRRYDLLAAVSDVRRRGA